ncbi:GNAT family N-acetyltransferase [Nonlabens sp. SCSIO 43208]|uniref:GNAT family N-acetyltransferase n=1 Tax=Nonlabens sp. SCSIO 43208 TaxID=2793009 RepID=UPI003D6A3782
MINIRQATQQDFSRVLELINELALFEKEPDAVEISIEDLIQNGTGNNPLFTCFVGEYKGNIEGMALCYPRFSTWKGVTIHLEDLIVTQKMRGVGLGKALYNEVLKHALKKGVRRVEWVVLDWNTHAIDFYKNTGATVFDEWRVVQMDHGSLTAYIDKQ